MKTNTFMAFSVCASLCALLCLPVQAQTAAPGIFIGEADIGPTARPGSSGHAPQGGSYTVKGPLSAATGNQPAFHFLYRKIKGDFILYARIAANGNGAPQRSAGWMIRTALDKDAAYLSLSAGEKEKAEAMLRYKKAGASVPGTVRTGLTGADVLQLERKGDTFTLRVARFGMPFITRKLSLPGMGEELYTGLYAESGDTGIFRDLRIIAPHPGDGKGESGMTLGSRLELLDVGTGDREIVYRVPYSIQAPNWTKDGQALIFNDNSGSMYRFDLSARKPERLNTSHVNHNNNDHVLSFDGTMLGLSSNVKEAGGSVIFTVPATGGEPRQITPGGPSYLHGWSPDGKFLVFCGERKGEFDVYKIPAGGGREIRLTRTKGLDDGPEYTPDGKYIYFNSVRSGSMQIWRMRPDGSGQEQVTDDGFNNWFPHISPDGHWVVFLSFPKEEAAPDSHPPYKHVYLRLMPLSGGKPRVLAYLYGGQGSINTPSWSPDSKKIAFISNSGPILP
ncbi:biopolymer transporter TolR [Compostibacter hankyongensis]|uniref:SMP-30/gluconolactonase/LRE family protein n=1 Tax=Compostibacter hankyongensis TaxID=1007089 RepID=A0ABP8FM24_9BACT